MPFTPNLTDVYIEDSYNQLLHTDGVSIYDGTGSLFNVGGGTFATTGSNSFNGNQTITGSLNVSSDITARRLVVNTVSSSVVYSSGSNIFGNDISNTQVFTGSLFVTGSSIYSGNVSIAGNLRFIPGATRYISMSAATTPGPGSSIILQAGDSNTAGTGGSLYFKVGAGSGGPGYGSIYIGHQGVDSVWPYIDISGPTTIYNSGPNTGTSLTVNGGGQLLMRYDWDNINLVTSAISSADRILRFTGASQYQIRGAGTTSSTTALLVQNSNASASLTVLDNGNVGIGTATPNYSLTVNAPAAGDGVAAYVGNAGIVITGNAGLGNPGIQVTAGVLHINATVNGTGGGEILNVNKSANGANIQQWRSFNSTVLSVVSGNGSIGVRTATPSASIHIIGTGSAADTTSLLIQNSGATSSLVVRDDRSIDVGNVLFTSPPGYSYIRGFEFGFTRIHLSGILLNFQINDITKGGFDPSGNLFTVSGSKMFVGTSTDGGYMFQVTGSGISGSFNANNVLYVSSSKVGIGTTNPNKQFTVSNLATNSSNKATIMIDANGTMDGAAQLIFSQNNLNWQSILSTHVSAGGAVQGLQLNDGGSPTFVTYQGRMFVGNTFTIPSASLHIKGSGTTSGTTALLVQNSNLSSSFTVRDDGSVLIGNNNTSGIIYLPRDPSYGDRIIMRLQNSNDITLLGVISQDTLYTNMSFTANNGITLNGNISGVAINGTGSIYNFITVANSFYGVGTVFNYAAQVRNQSGGSTNIISITSPFVTDGPGQKIRGFYYNPTISGMNSVADNVAIETTSGNIIFGNTVDSSSVAIGGTTTTLGGYPVPLTINVNQSTTGYGINLVGNGAYIGTSTYSNTILAGVDAAAVYYHYNYGSKDVHFGSVGSGNTLFKSSGNIGIGSNIATAAATAKLTIIGSGATSATTTLLVQNSNTATTFKVLDNGAVGINNSPADPTVALTVTPISGSTDNYVYLKTATGGSVNQLRFANTVTGSSGQEVGSLTWNTLANIKGLYTNNLIGGFRTVDLVVQGWSGSYAETARFTYDGKVGIGTSTPAYKLDVSGSGRFTSGLNITGSLILNGSDISSSWSSYTPAWTTDGGTQPALGDGALTGYYKQIGKTVFVRVKLNCGASTTFGTGTFQFSLPVSASSPDGIQFPCSILDNSVNWYTGTVNGTYTGATNKSAILINTSPATTVSSTAPFTWGNLDSLQFNGSYESV